MEQQARSTSKNRFLAAWIDNLIGFVLSLLVVGMMPGESQMLRVSALCLTYLGYFVLCEALWSRTLGKLICGLSVRQLDGTRCGWRAALIRTLTRIFETNPLFLGGLPAGLAILFSKRRQRLGDLLAGTVVVSTKGGR